MGRRPAGPCNRALADKHVAANVAWRLEVQLAVKVAVVSDLVTFVHRAVDEIRPSFRVSAKNKKGCFHPMFGERVKNTRSRVGIRTVVESQCDHSLLCWEMTHHWSEDEAVAVEGAVHRTTEHRQAE